MLTMVGCNKPDLSQFNTANKKEISNNVWLHRTSGSDVTITDKEGMGLVYGNVIRIRYESEKKSVIVAFKPFSSDVGENASVGAVEMARIELATVKVVKIDDLDGSIFKSLEDIKTFFP